MKKNYIILFLFFVSFQISFSQNIEQVSSDGFLSTTNKVRYNSADNSWIVAGVFYNNQPNTTSYIEGDTYLSKIDSTGNTVWKTFYNNSFPIAHVAGLDILSNNNIVLLSINSDCDVDVPDSLIQYNTNGVEISRIESPILFPNSIKAVNNNHFVLTSSDKISLIDNNWNIIWTHQLFNSSNTLSVYQAPNENIFAFTEAEILNLDINTGIAYSAYPANYTPKLTVAQQQDLFYLIDDTKNVLVIDTSFNFGFASFNIASHFDEVYKANVIETNKIAIHGKKNGYANVRLFDSGFTLLDSINWEVEHLFINDFDFNHNRIAVVGNDFSVKYSSNYSPSSYVHSLNQGSSHSFIKTFDYSLNSNIVGVDASVILVDYDNFSTSFDSCGSNYYSHNFTVDDVSVTVQNYGTETINHFKLFHRQTPNCPAFCPTANFYTFSIDTISIAPNTSKTIHIDQIKAPLQFAGAPFDLCFWAGEINHRIDMNHSNDKNCNALYSKTSHQTTIEQINIYPNPSSNQINLEIPSTFENIQFEIINAVGQTVKIEHTQRIDISDLANGFYFIKGTNEENKVFVGKFIKK